MVNIQGNDIGHSFQWAEINDLIVANIQIVDLLDILKQSGICEAAFLYYKFSQIRKISQARVIPDSYDPG